MGINERFKIVITHALANGQVQIKSINASEFFDADDYTESEWGCDLPWRFATLPEYLPSLSEVRSISLTVIDLRLMQELVVEIQNLSGLQLTMSWDDRRANPGEFEIILDFPRCSPETGVVVARLTVQEGKIKLTSQLLIEGDSVESLMPPIQSDPN